MLMTPHADPATSGDAAADPLERLYAFAQLLAPTAHEAEQLVVATYRRALEASSANEAAGDTADEPPYAALVRLLLQVRHEQRAAQGAAEEAPSGTTVKDPLSAVKERLLEHFLAEQAPLVFVRLPEDLRLLFVLSDLDGLSPAEAADVVGLAPEMAERRLNLAREIMQEALYQQASRAMRSLLDARFTPDRLRDALDTFLTHERTALPASLPARIDRLYQGPALPADESAAPMLPPARRDRSPARPFYQRTLFATGWIALAGLLGVLVVLLADDPPEADLVQLTAARAPEVEPVLRTTSPEEAAAFVSTQLGQSVRVPSVAEAALVGVGIQSIVPSAPVPVFVYADSTSDAPVVLYAFTYALLDMHAERLQLDMETLQRIAQQGAYDLYPVDDQNVLIWRHRDEIFVAVTTLDGQALQQRIQGPAGP